MKSTSLIPRSKESRSSMQPWKPLAYMRRGVKWLLEHAAAGLFLDPGLGKTSITLAALKILHKEGVMVRALIVAPIRVCHLVWPAEMEKWQDFSHFRYAILHGSDKDDELLERNDIDIYIINPEGLGWLTESSKRFRKLRADTLVIDESSKFKNAQTKRFKDLKPYLPTFRRRWILTGSPAPNGLLDLFGQVYIIDLGLSLGRYITHYRNKFFDPTGYGGFTWKMREGADKQIFKALKPYVLRMDADDYLELPSLVVSNIKVELPAKAREIYDRMEIVMFAQLDDGRKLTALTAGAASVKCRQIANGAAYLSLDNPVATKREQYAEIHTAKLDALEEYIEERQGKPTIVTYEFNHDLERILKRLGKKTPVMGGGASMKETARIEAAWNAGDIPVMLGQPQSMGHGLNLQASGDAIIWFSPIWDYEVYDQTIRRLRRQGSKNARIFVTHIIASDTVDLAVLGALSHKKKVQNALFDALSTYRKARKI